MRRRTLSLALAALAAAGTSQLAPSQLYAGDSEIAGDIMTRLKASRDAGNLKGFTLDMKVEDGIVSFRGQVATREQQKLVLAAADGLDGVVQVVNDLAIAGKIQPAPAAVAAVAPESESAAPAKPVSPEDTMDFASAITGLSKADVAASTPMTMPITPIAAAPAPAVVEAPAMVAAPAPTLLSSKPNVLQASAIDQPQSFEPPVFDQDEAVTNDIAAALSAAKTAGQLRRFGVDVDTVDGQVTLMGRASNGQQRQMIESIVAGVPGVGGIDNRITVATAPAIAPASHRAPVGLQPAPVRPEPVGTPLPRVPAMRRGTPAQMASYGNQVINGERVVPGSIVTHNGVIDGSVATGPAMGSPVMGGPVMGQPVPMAPAAAVGAPRYDTPNLPNYAWPGYAAYPNYAALTYPQQYSPSAFPYIGPFYPYPQVPLGWRRVALEWDDGWWHLDFSDRSH